MTATSATPPPRRFVLRDLTFPARLVLTAFLLSVGIGYVSAIVNLHMQEASPGEPVPNKQRVVEVFHGIAETSQMERVLTAHESLPFNGQGSMVPAFTLRRGKGIKQAIQEKAKKAEIDLKKNPAEKPKLEAEVLKEFDGQRQALVAWVKAGAPQKAYDDSENSENTGFLLTGSLKDLPVSEDCINSVETPEGVKRYAKIQFIIKNRCVTCHDDSLGGGGAAQFPLDTYEHVAVYCEPGPSSGMSLTKLALSTHVHLLGFSMLYGLTGFILAFSRLPFLLRLVLCPLPLIAQVLDISCWWLARLDGPLGETFAGIIPITGGIVALGLVAQILVSVFDMYGWAGRFILVLLFVGVGAGAFLYVRPIVENHLKQEGPVKIEQPAGSTAEPVPAMPKAE